MTNRSVGRPLIVSAAITADGPGAVVTRSPAAATAATTRAPGSLMPGVPASLIDHDRLTAGYVRDDLRRTSGRLVVLVQARESRRTAMAWALKSVFE